MTDPQKFAPLVASFRPGGKLLRAWTLTGGVSATVTALEIEHDNGLREKVVVREYGEGDLAGDPHIAQHEFQLLRALHLDGLPVPEPYIFDSSGVLLPTPSIVIEFIDGQTEFAPADLDDCLLQLATMLARIHQTVGYNFNFLPNRTEIIAQRLRQRPTQLDDSINEGRIRDALETRFPPPPHNPSGLLHGDYWLGNILWRDAQIAAVIDWEDAAVGDPLADLANARLELVFAFGMDAMQAFTRHYQAQTSLDYANLPIWDLCAALKPAHKIAEWAGDAETERRWRTGHAAFTAQAFERLA